MPDREGKHGERSATASIGLHDPPRLGLRFRPHAPQQWPAEDGSRDHDRGADGGDKLQRLGEGIAGCVSQLGGERVGEPLAHRHGTPERVARSVRRVRRDTRGDRLRHLAAVDGSADDA
jgi:hypothetical protein